MNQFAISNSKPSAIRNTPTPAPWQSELGIDQMWLKDGGDGSLASFADIEQGWNSHRSIAHMALNVSDLTIENDPDSYHGTQVLTTIGAMGDGLVGVAYGVKRAQLCGVAYQASPGNLNFYPPRSVYAASVGLVPGDVVLFEVALADSTLPLEFYSSNGSTSMSEQIQRAIDLGLVVVMSAGNGGRPIDTATLAICVGACNEDKATRYPSSNFGFVDCCAWGSGIMVGSTFQGQEGTSTFRETSAAAAIIAGVVLGVQSARKSVGKRPLRHSSVRTLLRDTSLGFGNIPGVGNLPHAGKLIEAALELA